MLYVDNIIVTGNTLNVVHNIIYMLSLHFSLKDLGPLNYFFRCSSTKPFYRTFPLSIKLLGRFKRCSHDDKKGVFTQMSNSNLLHQDKGIPVNESQYHTILGKFSIFLSHVQTYYVNKLSQFMYRPLGVHWLHSNDYFAIFNTPVIMVFISMRVKMWDF